MNNFPGNKLPSYLAEIPDFIKNIPTRKSLASHILFFFTDLNPLSMTSFYVKKHDKSEKIKRSARNNEYYDNIDEYGNINKDPIDIKNLEEVDIEDQRLGDFERMVNNIRKDQVNTINKDSELLKHRTVIGDFERISFNEESRRSRERSKYDDIFSKMDEGEMRMLSDDPNLRKDFTMTYGYYPGCVGDNREPANRSSGAYIFRPNSTNPKPYNHEVKVQNFIDNGDIRRTVTTYGDDLSIIRTDYVSLNTTEISWFVRIFVDDGVGKDVVLTYKTDILNNGQFYTDSNGRQMLKRILNKRPQWNVTLEEPVAGNYYPVVNEIYIENQDERFTVLTDRAEGGASLVEGEIQLMLHRRLLHDDAFGVGEALNETALGQPLVAVGTHIIIHAKGDDPKKDDINIEKAKLQLHNRPTIFVSDAKEIILEDWLKLDNHRTFASKPLPDGLHLLTLEPRGDDLLLRIENYMTKGPHSTISIDLRTIFNNIKLLRLKETMLAANQWADDSKKWKWKTENEFMNSFNNAYGNDIVGKTENDKDEIRDDGFVISLKAKQIRTFVISYELM